ncbi:MAG: HD domain-containing protein [Oscillospiraceae bacterium]|nr:HD domain-containing protein [Oscillospiraceae bacterium]
MKFKLSKNVITALSLLNDAGFSAYLVGGSVRDMLMEKPPTDWDLNTSALPGQIKEAFASFKTIDTGLRHGTVTVVIDGMNIEITTFRLDGEYSDFRRPDTVEFTDDLREDLSRRDFTVNAIAYNPIDGVIDPFSGLADIENKLIRTVGPPEKRFSEDALRILRAVRFASVLGFNIEEETGAAVKDMRETLANVSVQRISVELKKLLCGMNAFEVLRDYPEVIFTFLPELETQKGYAQKGKKHAYDIWGHTCHVVAGVEPDPFLRLAALLHDSGKPVTAAFDEKGNHTFKNHAKAGAEIAEAALRRLCFDNKTIKTVRDIIAMHDLEIPETKPEVLRVLNKYGAGLFECFLKIKKADRGALSDGYNDVSGELDKCYKILDNITCENVCYTLSDLHINGDDLMTLGISGKQTGEILDMLLDAVISGNCENKKEDLIKYIQF